MIVAPAVRLLTWNIHGALGRNPRFDLDRVVDLIRRWKPDLIVGALLLNGAWGLGVALLMRVLSAKGR